MRQPARRAQSATKQPTANSMSYPAPVRGWNARDALADMRPDEAVALDNWFPKSTYCEIRGGHDDHLTGITGNGKTLTVYNAMSGTNKMFVASASGVWDASSAGAAGATAAACTNGKFQWLNFGDGTNNWLIMVNGVDKPLYYNGTTWTSVDAASTPALTGLTTTNIIGVMEMKGRLVFIQKESLSFWYLAAGAAGGALTEYDLSGVATKGGYLVAVDIWTRDAGDGPDDFTVFITSEGQALVYQGNNPADANAWAKVGTYDIGRPLGRHCTLRYGGDLVILTENGAFPLSAALVDEDKRAKMALSFKIEPVFTEAARLYGSNYGWDARVYPAQSALIVNIPIAEDGTHYQYVMNTVTKAWCRFLEWDAEDFAVFNGELYFTTSNKVVKAWSGQADGSDSVIAYGKPAFSYFGSPGVDKQFVMFRPVLAVNGPLTFLTDIDVDLQDSPIAGEATYNVTSGAQWDVSNWDEAYFAAGLEVVKEWTSPDAWTGRCASGKVKISTDSLTVQWLACDYIFTKGGQL